MTLETCPLDVELEEARRELAGEERRLRWKERAVHEHRVCDHDGYLAGLAALTERVAELRSYVAGLEQRLDEEG